MAKKRAKVFLSLSANYQRQPFKNVVSIGMNPTWINLDVYEYDLDLDTLLFITPNSTISSLSDIFLLSAYACAVYIDMAAKTKVTSKKNVKKEEKVIF